MNFSKKLNALFILALVCLILLMAASYAWLAISTRPEVNSIDTNIGANGSLEIALLSERTYADPVLIRTTVGDSAVERDAVESNQTWGNVIELNDAGYGLENITLYPARLNVFSENGQYIVSRNILNTAQFGIDGRMTSLSEDTISAIYGENGFTYYVDRQLYGVRAIGTMSNLTSQQTALALARSNVKAYTAAASRSVKYAWRDYASEIMDILSRRYMLENDSFTTEDASAVRNLTNGVLQSLEYMDASLRQGMIGIAASNIVDEVKFEALCTMISDTSVPLSTLVDKLGNAAPAEFVSWAEQVDEMKTQGQLVLANSYTFANGDSWEKLERMLDVLLDAERVYMGERCLADKEAFGAMTGDNTLVLSPDSGLLAQIAAYVGNYSAFSMWTDNTSVELRTADPNQTAVLIQLEEILKSCKAASGGWTRANMDDVYGFAVDLAFRCNEETDLLLQTVPMMRVEENAEVPVTQGGGSYMRFTSENMDTEQLLQLMDTIRVGFLNDRNQLLGVAKLNISKYEEQDEGVFAPLYLYSYTLKDDGILSVEERQSDNTAILTMSRNSPVVVTVVVWMDGDSVNNGMVNATAHQSMNGVMNLQFSGSANLLPANISMEEKK